MGDHCSYRNSLCRAWMHNGPDCDPSSHSPSYLSRGTSLGYDPIWFGVIVVALAELGLATPPVGLNVYITSAVSEYP